MKNLFAIFSLISLFSISVTVPNFAQVPNPKPVEMPVNSDQGESSRQRMWEEQRTNRALSDSFKRDVAEGKFNPQFRPLNTDDPISKKERELYYNTLRAVNPDDLLEYKEFLKKPKTGIFRLFPNFDCDQKLLIKVNGDCAGAVPYSWSYSFRQKNYADEFFDIRMNNGRLIADSFFSQGILVDLGNVSLSDISADDSRVKFLTDFKPQKKFKGARSQFIQLAKGITSGEYVYTKSVKTDVNTTYAARFIAYQPTYKIYRSNYSRVGYDKRTDLSIAFRIIRIDKDGSLTIVWKTLDQKDSPKLIFEKDDSLMDIKPENPNKK